jgi:conjugative relaxase-like TrwC/TraI family protein
MRPLNMSASQAMGYYYENDPIFSKCTWQGRGAGALALSGKVKKTDFINLINGNDPEGNQIVSDGVNAQHRGCIDIPFSAPKSVSIVALHVGDDRLVSAHIAAVEHTIDYIEANYIYARKTENGMTCVEKTGKGVFATFTHSTSRENDPQLHTHTLTMNMTRASNGWRAVWNDQVFKDQHLINSVYRGALAKAVYELGYSIYNQANGTWEIAGVSRPWIDIFSKRTEAIDNKEEELKSEEKFSEGLRRNIAVLDSRPEKDALISKDELRNLWEQQVPREKIRARVNREIKIDYQLTGKDYITLSLSAIHETESTFKKKDLVDHALCLSRGNCTVLDIEKAFLKTVRAGLIVPLSEFKNSKGLAITVYASAEMKAAELSIAATFKGGKKSVAPMVLPATVEQYFDQHGPYLTHGQKETIRHILTSNDRFMIIQGDAGVGKTTAMGAIKDILAKEHKEHSDPAIYGLGYTGKAAVELESRAGFSCQTITSFLSSPPEKSPAKLWIVDESSMVGSLQMKGVLEAATAHDARVVFIGDGKQLCAINAGRMFNDLQEGGYVKTVKMAEVIRQKTAYMKKTVRLIKDFQEGKNDHGIDEAFKVLGDKGNLAEIKDRADRLRAAAGAFFDQKSYQDTLIITPRNKDRVELNGRIRQGLKQQGVIDQSDYRITIKTPVSLPGTSRYFAAAYPVGQSAFIESPGEHPEIKAGQPVVILARDLAQNTITVASKEGKAHQIDLKKDRTTLSLYNEHQQDFSPRDRVIFLKNDKRLNVVNGSTGTISGIDADGKISVRLDSSSRTVYFHTRHYAFFDLGYAVTTHKSQGQTTGDVIFVADTKSDRLNRSELFNVAMTRAEQGVRIYTDDIDTLKEQFQRSQAKTSVLKALQQPVRAASDKEVSKGIPDNQGVSFRRAKALAIRGFK